MTNHMQLWESLLNTPNDFSDGQVAWNWFYAIAQRLLNGSRLMVNAQPHRLVEIEFYYYGEHHFDPFAHRDPVQLERGRWYFHRTGGAYRGGSFKGFDLSFGDDRSYGGVLIRSIETKNRTLISGPSLCVDHLLAKTGAKTVVELERRIAQRKAWAQDNPLRLQTVETNREQPLYQTARVGLTLKRTRESPDPPRFILRPYRFLTEPRRVGKGKAHLVLALYLQGLEQQSIHETTGCPRRSIQRYIDEFHAGQAEPDFSAYLGKELTTTDLCRLHGTWQRTALAN